MDNSRSILKVMNQFGVSYRYAAPEVFGWIERTASSSLTDFQRADSFSFGITVWELLQRQAPWEETPNFDDVKAKVTSGLRPEITFPFEKDPKLVMFKQLIEYCWNQTPTTRPNFQDIEKQLDLFMSQMVGSSDIEVQL